MRITESIFLSAAVGNSESIKNLVENGCPVDSLCSDLKIDGQRFKGMTPLMIAVSRGYYRTVECLLALGANANFEEDEMGITPLIMAVSSGKNGDNFIRVTDLLLDHQADVNYQDRFGKTAAMHAISSDGGQGDIDIVRRLLDRGYNVDLAESNGRTVIDMASQQNRQDVAVFIQSYVDNRRLDGYIMDSRQETEFSF